MSCIFHTQISNCIDMAKDYQISKFQTQNLIFAKQEQICAVAGENITDPRVPSCTCLYPSVASSSDSLMSTSHQADVRLGPGSDYCC